MQLEDISDDDVLYRRIAFEDVTGDVLNRGAFSLRPGEDYLSVDLARLTSVAECLARPRPPRPDLGLAALRVGDVRALNLIVVHDPIIGDSPETSNPAHARILGENSRMTKKRLSERANIFVHPSPRQ